jgi:hypothetical protein
MVWWILGIGAAFALLFVVMLVWGVLHLRGSVRAAEQAIARVTLDRVEPLARECERVFRERFGETLVLADLEAAATCLSTRLDDLDAMKAAFAKDDLYWHVVLPVGAYVGELLRMHAGGRWRASAEGGLEMTIVAGEGEATTYPFDKVLKQATMGDKGDLVAYLMTAPKLGDVVREMVEDAPAA